MRHGRFAVGLAILVLVAAAPAAKSPAPAGYGECPDIPHYYSTQDERAILRAARTFQNEHFGTFEGGSLHFGRNFQPAVPAREMAEEFAVYGYSYVGQYHGYMLFEQYAYGSFAIGKLARFLANTGFEQPYPSPQRLVLQPPFIGGVPIPPDLVAFPCR